MSFAVAALPDRLYRVARSPDPLRLTEWLYIRQAERGRWDDTDEEYRVLYCCSTEVGAMIETLQDLRPSQTALTELDSITSDEGDVEDSVPSIIAGRLRNRWFATLIPGNPGHRVAAVAEKNSRIYLEDKLHDIMTTLGIVAIKVGDLTGSDRRLSRHASRLAYDEGHVGLVAPSAEHANSNTYALFEARPVSMELRTQLVPNSVVLALERADVARHAAVELGFSVA